MKQFALLFLLVILLLQPAQAGEFHTEITVFERGDHAAMLREWTELAKQGEALAQYNVGFLYDHGLGTKEHNARALRWYRRAAEQDYLPAVHMLGILYSTGEGVKRNDERAVRYYRHAA